MSAIATPTTEARSTTGPLGTSTTDATGAWSDLRAGAGLMAPLVVAYVPFALVVGTTLAHAGGLGVGVTGTVLIFAGSAHLATIRTLQQAGLAAAVLTGLVINARLVVYSAGLARRWAGQPRWFRLVAAALIIDPTWAAGERLAEEVPDLRRQRLRFLAAGSTLGAGFAATVVVGMLAGDRFGAGGLEVAVPLCLLALIAPSLGRADDRRVIAVAALVALVGAGWPAGTGLLAATVAGTAAGAFQRAGASGGEERT